MTIYNIENFDDIKEEMLIDIFEISEIVNDKINIEIYSNVIIEFIKKVFENKKLEIEIKSY